MRHAILIFVAAIGFGLFAKAEEVYKIKVGSNYRNYSNRELRERVWDLERAVAQLQERIYQLEADGAATAVATKAPAEPEKPDTWVCTISAMGKPYVGTGPTKAVATAKATENCMKAKGQDGFFCKDPKCEQ